MGNALNKKTQVTASRAFQVLAACAVLALLTGCPSGGGGGGGDGGKVVNEKSLLLGSNFVLYCPDVGIADETCILDDPDNPYARSAINDDTKFDLAGDSPSAKSDFYLWGTAQAKSPRGENQYFTALALHTLFTQGGSENAREQAKRAYKSVLDNYFGSVTFYKIPTAEGDLLLPQSLRELVGDNLYNPGAANLSQLYLNQARALEALGKWGYFYDEDTGLVTKNE